MQSIFQCFHLEKLFLGDREQIHISQALRLDREHRKDEEHFDFFAAVFEAVTGVGMFVAAWCFPPLCPEACPAPRSEGGPGPEGGTRGPRGTAAARGHFGVTRYRHLLANERYCSRRRHMRTNSRGSMGTSAGWNAVLQRAACACVLATESRMSRGH